MAPYDSRRGFLRKTTSVGVLAGLGNLGTLTGLAPVSAADAALDPKTVRLDGSIEPLVRLLEDSPREKVLEEVAARIRQGASYREILAALLLAGVRNIQPRPVGFKFHAVLVVNSAHLASISSPPEHRWLPIFWAIDEFKSAQAQDKKEGDWTMSAVEESAVPPPHKARAAFIEAMDNWDVAAADVAIAGLARAAGLNEIFELMARYGSRDFRDIGHKAIYVANSYRTLGCIGAQHAEPVLRSLTYALLAHEGDNPAKRDGDPDRPGRKNAERLAKFKPEWLGGKPDESATREMLATLRSASPDECCDKALELINRGAAPQSIWDSLFVGSGELLVRQSGIVSLHAVTSTNALRYAWETTASDETRKMLLLQNAAFVPLFRQAMAGRGQLKAYELDGLQPVALKAESAGAIDEIFTDVSGDKLAAAGKLFAYLQNGGDAKPLIDAARVLIFRKGSNAHDYKFSSAVLEDFYHVSPAWRNRYLASSVFNLRGSQGNDNGLVKRTQAALA